MDLLTYLLVIGEAEMMADWVFEHMREGVC